MGRMWKEMSSGPVSLERAKEMILTKDMGDGSAALAYELLQRFIAEDRIDDAVQIALLAHEQGLYGKMNHAGLFNLVSGLSDSLNIMNRDAYAELSAMIDEEDVAPHRRHVTYRQRSKAA